MDEMKDEVRSGAKQMVRGEACASRTLCVEDSSFAVVSACFPFMVLNLCVY